jgi:protein MpaA
VIFDEVESGETVGGNEIEVFKTNIKSKKYLYLIAGTHGDEVEGVYVLKQLFDWIKTEHSLKDLPLIVIPILNVDGYKAQTRVNANGVDLNRNLATSDWIPTATKERYNPGKTPMSEPENKFLVKLFDKYKPGFIISFHSWKPIINYNGDSQDVAKFLSIHNEYPVAGDIGYITPGSLGTYVPEKYNAGVITFECPTLEQIPSLKEIWKQNEKSLKELFLSDLITKKLV